MPRYLEKTISALVYEVAATHDCPAQELHPDYNDIVTFILEQLNRMPRFLAWAVKMATSAFGASRVMLEGSFFHQRDSSRRRLQIEVWKRSRLGVCRDLMRFYTGLVVLALYSRPSSDRSRGFS
jgi:hypothetical protein